MFGRCPKCNKKHAEEEALAGEFRLKMKEMRMVQCAEESDTDWEFVSRGSFSSSFSELS